MRILVYGAGALGSLVGGLLSRRNDVTLLSRPAHARAIQKSGLKITGLENFTARPSAVSSLSPASARALAPELIILTVKSYSTQKAAKQIKRLFPGSAPVLSLQNGLGNIETLRGILGRRRVMAGLTSHGITWERAGLIRHTGDGDTVLGEPDGTTTARVRAIKALFDGAGMKCRLSANMHGEIWAKAIVNAGINPITAITRLENGWLLEIPLLRDIMKSACREGALVARAAGVSLPPGDPAGRAMTVARRTARNRSSMLQDIEKGKKTEIRAISGAIAAEGRRAGVPVPVNTALAALVLALEHGARRRCHKSRASTRG